MFNRFGFVTSYKWRHFFLRYGIVVFLFLMIPFLVVYISLWYYNLNEADRQTVFEGKETVYDVSSKIENTFSFFDSIYSSVLTDSTIDSYLRNANLSESDASNYVQEITQILNNYRFSSPHIDDIYLLKTSNNYVITVNQSNLTNNYIEKFADADCFSNISGSYDFLVSRSVKFSNNPKNYITCYYPIYAKHSNDLLTGMLVLNVQTDIFLKQIADIVPQNSEVCIFYSGKPLASTNGINDLFKKYLSNSNGSNFVKRYQGANVVAGTSIKAHNISVVFSYQSDIFKNNWFLNIRTLLIIFAIILLISILSAYIITDNFYKMVADIIIETTDVMDLYEKDKEYTKKFDKLSKRILFAFEKNTIIEKSLYDRMKYLRDSQFAALQTQITPHFLFNTLNILNLLELKIVKKRSEIGKVVTSLSDILRYSMDTQNYLVSFKDELSYTLKYLDIQNLRYGDELEINYDISNDAMDFTVLKFILQPILENAIHYAIANNKKGVISLITKTRNNTLYIQIQDNGNALTKEKAYSLKQMLDKGLIAADHTSGLLNTNKRLKMIFGENYKCNIFAHNGETTVSFEIPKI